jgi:8-oxo-dGTP diphosphatase
MARRRGTAIVETQKGILVASGRHKIFLLPGGNAKVWESRKRAAIRELKEETSLRKYYCKYLFTYHEPKGSKHRAFHKVFLIKATGHPRPHHHDVKYINYWKPGSRLRLSRNTKKIIDIYLENYKTTPR